MRAVPLLLAGAILLFGCQAAKVDEWTAPEGVRPAGWAGTGGGNAPSGLGLHCNDEDKKAAAQRRAADHQCGRVVFSTFHVAEGDDTVTTLPPRPFPVGCSNKPLTPQEKALEFMLFDASACVQPDSERPRVFEPPPPAPPPPPPTVD